MLVYKAFFKIIKKNMAQIAIYFVIFLFLAVFLASIYTDPANMDFMESKIDMVFISHDKDSKLVDGLKEFIGEKGQFILLQMMNKSSGMLCSLGKWSIL